MCPFRDFSHYREQSNLACVGALEPNMDFTKDVRLTSQPHSIVPLHLKPNQHAEMLLSDEILTLR